MIAALKGFTQQLVPVNGIRINAVTGGAVRRSFCFTAGRKHGGNGTM